MIGLRSIRAKNNTLIMKILICSSKNVGKTKIVAKIDYICSPVTRITNNDMRMRWKLLKERKTNQ